MNVLNLVSGLGVYKWVAIGVGLSAITGGAFVSGWANGSAMTQGKWDAAVVANAKGEAAALKAAAEAIAKIEVKSEQIIQPIRTEIRTNTVYRECKHSADSVRGLNALIEGTEPASYSLVPKGKPAGGRLFRRHD